jgi:hypothetical protein
MFDAKGYIEKRRQDMKSKNLCTRCGNPTFEGKPDCPECTTETKQRGKSYREKCRQDKVCISCGGSVSSEVLRCESCRAMANKNGRDTQKKNKTSVMTHYGKDGKLICCWDGCIVNDVDMLTLDHIENNGAEHRREYTKTGRGGGAQLYNKLIAEGFPKGYQTLCANHNLKKHILNVRGA